ncbi:aerobic-type carbon monoxide dehydrogenase small subunit (CoxS/CutS family) [Streptacidiphilus sp. MAP12-16]|uniref:2Fe-2S iron-sulfur cluster-binding protein n=1 Tax=Streptacidiphilus sp. MAP12-16 TaxID=3156300 RepID=UPI0035180E72
MTDYLTNPATLGMTGMTGFGAPDESPRVSYTLRVNGLERPVNEAWIGESLLYVLRERLGLAGAKGGCDQGECGACSVQLDGQLTAACLVPAALAADSEIRTVEGLAADGTASDVQRALAESGAVQCGYCVPGLAMAVHDLLERNHQPTELQAREALCGNLCRCTGYRGALEAVQTVARSRAEEAAAESDDDEQAADGAEHGATAAEAEAPAAPAAEAELPVYVQLPAQQQDEFRDEYPSNHQDGYQVEGEQPAAEADPLFGPIDDVAGVPAQPHYAYPNAAGSGAGDYTAAGPDSGGYTAYSEGGTAYPADYADQPQAGYTQAADYTQPGYQQAEYVSSDYPTVSDYPADPYPQQGNPPDPAAGVYVLPHQHQHAPAPEAGV